MAAKIEKIFAREVLDSRGFPTVQADVVLDSGVVGRATAPSGASTGKLEAYELRDGNAKRYAGKGVLGAVGNVRGEIAKTLSGSDPTEQEKIDMGYNPGYAVALPCEYCVAARIDRQQPLGRQHRDPPPESGQGWSGHATISRRHRR